METRIVGLPFVHADTLLSAYRVGWTKESESTLRTLRSNGVVSTGLEEALPGDGGRWVGRIHLYCSLSLDAVRLARLDRQEDAKRLVTEANVIEQSTAAHLVAQALAAHVSIEGSSDVAAITGAFRKVALDSLILPRLQELSLAIAAASQRVNLVQPDVTTAIGRVIQLTRSEGVLQFENGSLHRLPIDQLKTLGLGRLGAPVVLRSESLPYGQNIVAVEPGLEIPMPARGRRGSAFAQPTEEGWRRVEGVLEMVRPGKTRRRTTP